MCENNLAANNAAAEHCRSTALALQATKDVAKRVYTESEALKDAIEFLIDRFTILGIVVALGDVCQGKADQLAANWQDVPTSEAWQQLSEQVYCLECDGL